MERINSTFLHSNTLQTHNTMYSRAKKVDFANISFNFGRGVNILGRFLKVMNGCFESEWESDVQYGRGRRISEAEVLSWRAGRQVVAESARAARSNGGRIVRWI
ncbi:hypothetical protein GOODEAATRI_026978 [Goodea atripinnis]|uniref:Uncharacterized protein n=1 Tax=Goodea atripinnis TaxID=208336 RepID=A0ABV0N4P1_9TELE